MDADFREFKARVLEATDIVALVSEYVALRRSGTGFKGLCPFHEERTPSFSVNPERGSWYCFGRCARGGNAIDFLMEKERLEFWPALLLLAERAGISPPKLGGKGSESGDATNKRKRLLEMQRVAADFFQMGLWKSREGEVARRYVAERGIEVETARRFELGYAPRAGSHLLQALRKRGYTNEEIVAAGLATERGGALRDRFRARLVFPIHDALGRVVGFGARTLEPDGVPKYLNTPETPIFKKRELIYGLHRAKDAIREAEQVAVVEGYTDVILAHQAGLGWFVATLGTAFGEGHARVLRRFTDRVVAFFDGDAAGRRANRRALEELAGAVFGGDRPFASFRVASLPDGLDPAELVMREGAEALAEAARRAEPFVHALVPKEAVTWPAERRRALAEPVARVLAAFDNDLDRELQLRELAHRLGLSEDLIRSLASRIRAQAVGQRRQHTGDGGVREHREQEQENVGDESTGSKGATSPPPRLERHFLRCVLALGEAVADEARQALERGWLTHPVVCEGVKTLIGGSRVANIEGDQARALASREAATLDRNLDWQQMWAGVLARLEQECERRRAARLGLEDPGSDAALRAFQDTQRRLKARQQST